MFVLRRRALLIVIICVAVEAVGRTTQMNIDNYDVMCCFPVKHPQLFARAFSARIKYARIVKNIENFAQLSFVVVGTGALSLFLENILVTLMLDFPAAWICTVSAWEEHTPIVERNLF